MSYDHKDTERVAQTLEKNILAILCLHQGADKAIKAKDIARQVGLTGRYADRPVREAIKRLRRQGHLILSSIKEPYGYFLAETEEEWREFRDTNLKPRALDILETAGAMGRAAAERWHQDDYRQLRLNLIGAKAVKNRVVAVG
jgi:hypothetical protein